MPRASGGPDPSEMPEARHGSPWPRTAKYRLAGGASAPRFPGVGKRGERATALWQACRSPMPRRRAVCLTAEAMTPASSDPRWSVVGAPQPAERRVSRAERRVSEADRAPQPAERRVSEADGAAQQAERRASQAERRVSEADRAAHPAERRASRVERRVSEADRAAHPAERRASRVERRVSQADGAPQRGEGVAPQPVRAA
jgi:hypothetical protein